MSSLKQFKRDKSKVDGVWFGKELFEPNPDGTYPEFLIAPAHKSNDKFVKAQVKWRRDNQRLYLRRNADIHELSEKGLEYAFRVGCVRNWRNFQDDEAVQIPFDLEHVNYYMDEYHDLHDALVEFAYDRHNYIEEAVEAVKGESLSTTSGA